MTDNSVTMICPACGKEIPRDSQYCSHCGTPQIDNSPDSPNAVISIKRYPNLTAALAKFEVYIDNVKVGTVANNAQGQFEVRPGTHVLQLKLDTFTSRKANVALAPGTTIQLVCWPKPLGLGIHLGLE
jgi:hypothetical protein